MSCGPSGSVDVEVKCTTAPDAGFCGENVNAATGGRLTREVTVATFVAPSLSVTRRCTVFSPAVAYVASAPGPVASPNVPSPFRSQEYAAIGPSGSLDVVPANATCWPVSGTSSAWPGRGFTVENTIRAVGGAFTRTDPVAVVVCFALFVTVIVTVLVPAVAYAWLAVVLGPVLDAPSPKAHATEVI